MKLKTLNLRESSRQICKHMSMFSSEKLCSFLIKNPIKDGGKQVRFSAGAKPVPHLWGFEYIEFALIMVSFLLHCICNM